MSFVAVNETAAELLAYSRDELVERGLADISLERDLEGLFHELVERGDLQGSAVARRGDGGRLVARFYARRVPGSEDLYVSFFLPRRVIPPDATSQRDASRRSRDVAAPSAREIEILELVADGLENEEIGKSLHLAPDTVKAHISRLLRKLGARSRTHAVALALRRGLID